MTKADIFPSCPVKSNAAMATNGVVSGHEFMCNSESFSCSPPPLKVCTSIYGTPCILGLIDESRYKGVQN